MTLTGFGELYSSLYDGCCMGLNKFTIGAIFTQKITLFMSLEKLRLINISFFQNLEQAPNEDTWTILVIGNFENQKTS
jgi:hypothetical protein